MSLPTFSVLMTNYNQGSYLDKALDAILSQSLRPNEIIILDDCSTDNSMEILQRWSEIEPIIRVIRHDVNKGAMYSISRINEEATCDYIHRIGPDDLVLPGFYEKSLKLLSIYPQAGLSSAVVQSVDEKGKYLRLHPCPPYVSKSPCFISPEQALGLYAEYGNWYGATSAIWKREVISELEADSSDELTSFSDNFLFYQIALSHGVCFIPEPLSVWRVVPNALTARVKFDPEKFRSLMDLAENLMKTTCQKYFPEKFVDEFARRNHISIGYVALNKRLRDSINSLDKIILGEGEMSWLTSSLYYMGKLAIKIQISVLRLILNYPLNHFFRQIFFRAVESFKNRNKYI